MKTKNSLYEEIDLSRLYNNGQEIKHKSLTVNASPKKGYLTVENLSGKILEVKFSEEMNAMHYFVKIGESRHVLETKDSKKHKIYIRLVDKK